MFGRSSNSVVQDAKAAEAAQRTLPPPLEGRSETRSADVRADGLSVIGRDLAISGDNLRIVTRGGIRIDGEVRGDIYGSEVQIGETGRVRGTVVGERVSIDGRIEGSVQGLKIELLKRAHVEGEIHHQTIRMEEGAFIEGALRRVSEETLRSAMAQASDDMATNV